LLADPGRRSFTAFLVAQTAPFSIPTEASSPDGLTMTGRRRPVGSWFRRAIAKGGTGTPARSSKVFATCLRWQSVMAEARQPVKGTPISSRAPTDQSS
jgi:hypothetical protein